MSLRQRISLREYGLSEPVPLTDAQLASLNTFTSFVEVKAGSAAGQYCLQAGSWVGDLLLPGLVISVVPKIGPTNLLALLLAGDGEATPEEIVSFTQRREDNFWDFLGNALISETARLVAYGLARSYVEEEGNLQFPVGQILFGRDFLENTPVRKGIQCRHTVLTEDINNNRIIKWGLETLSQLASDGVALRLSAASKWLELTESPIVCPEFSLPERADRYFMPLYLVHMLLRFSSIGAGAFGRRGQGYLVDMNRVFEGYVRQQLRHRLQKVGVLVVRKGEEDRNLCDGVRLEPDLVLVDATSRAPLAIADCKYKRNWGARPSFR